MADYDGEKGFSPKYNGRRASPAKRCRLLWVDDTDGSYSGQASISHGNFLAMLPFHATDSEIEFSDYSGKILTKMAGDTVTRSPGPYEKSIIDNAAGHLSSVWGDLDRETVERENGRFKRGFIDYVRKWFSDDFQEQVDRAELAYRTREKLSKTKREWAKSQRIRPARQIPKPKGRAPSEHW